MAKKLTSWPRISRVSDNKMINTPGQTEEEKQFYFFLVESLKHDNGTIKRQISHESSKKLLSEFMLRVNPHTIIYCSDSSHNVEWMRHTIQKENYHFLNLEEMESAIYKGSDALVIVDLFQSTRHEIPIFYYECCICVH